MMKVIQEKGKRSKTFLRKDKNWKPLNGDMKKHETEVTLKWTIPNFLSTFLASARTTEKKKDKENDRKW